MSVPAQIAVLLALIAGLFDNVPLEQMSQAEQAVQKAAVDIPAAVRGRLDTAQKLGDEDREMILHVARELLKAFAAETSLRSDTVQSREE